MLTYFSTFRKFCDTVFKKIRDPIFSICKPQRKIEITIFIFIFFLSWLTTDIFFSPSRCNRWRHLLFFLSMRENKRDKFGHVQINWQFTKKILETMRNFVWTKIIISSIYLFFVDKFGYFCFFIAIFYAIVALSDGEKNKDYTNEIQKKKNSCNLFSEKYDLFYTIK